MYTYDGCHCCCCCCSRPAFLFFLFILFFVNFNCIRNIGSVLCMSDIDCCCQCRYCLCWCCCLYRMCVIPYRHLQTSILQILWKYFCTWRVGCTIPFNDDVRPMFSKQKKFICRWIFFTFCVCVFVFNLGIFFARLSHFMSYNNFMNFMHTYILIRVCTFV